MGDEGLGVVGVVLDQAHQGGDRIGAGNGQQLADCGPVEAQHGLRVAGGIGVAGEAHFGQGEDVHVAGGGLGQEIGDLLQILSDGGLFTPHLRQGDPGHSTPPAGGYRRGPQASSGAVSQAVGYLQWQASVTFALLKRQIQWYDSDLCRSRGW